MGPEKIRKHWGFGALCASSCALFAASPALAAPASASQFIDVAPYILTIGALGFSVIAASMLRNGQRRSRSLAMQATNHLAQIRAELDVAQSVLAGLPELTLIWRDVNKPPAIFGQTAILGQGRNIEAIDFRTWLGASEGIMLSKFITRLKADGTGFDTSLTSVDGTLMRLSGRVLGGAAVLRIRPAIAQPETRPVSGAQGVFADSHSAEQIFDLVTKPSWLRDSAGNLVYANAAYWKLAKELDCTAAAGQIPEILNPAIMQSQTSTVMENGAPVTQEDYLLGETRFDIVIFPTETGTAGFLRQKDDQAAQQMPALQFGSDGGIIDAIAMPVAIFDAGRRLKHFNAAYSRLWGLDEAWLNSGIDEAAILDRLRTQGLLPSEADYRAWRARHLSSYKLTAPREEPWYLPDGRTLNVVAAPDRTNGGVIYVFENITEQLALESRYNALINVQSETLGALHEAVAVFGTNGRLTLSNPRLSSLWKLPMNELGQHPHIDQIAQSCAKSMPEDGASIWRELKHNIIDLNPARTDRNGRITRFDGRMIDYTVTRLPDGQTMMTFTDVTESANYQKLLKERNDALVTADRLKDAFVQNVSYELRSPLTNIIGFAEILASGDAGQLTEKQKTYTDYIRASSQALGVLIDNILDLATVDAGIAELELAPQDVSKLVERARAGLIGTLSSGGDGTPPNLSVEIAPDLPEFIADGTRITQMLYNLLSNAVRFSAPGSPVHLGITVRGGHMVFTVDDEGVGISDEMRAAVFQRFEGRSTEGRQRGAGLGLAIVKTFVNLHGGTISLERREPRGTRVIVSIPTNPASAISAAE